MNISIMHTKTQPNTDFFGATPDTQAKALIIMNIISQVWGDRFNATYDSDTINVYTFNDTTIDEVNGFFAQYSDVFGEMDEYCQANHITITSVPHLK
jgi:hypothetical protein